MKRLMSNTEKNYCTAILSAQKITQFIFSHTVRLGAKSDAGHHLHGVVFESSNPQSPNLAPYTKDTNAKMLVPAAVWQHQCLSARTPTQKHDKHVRTQVDSSGLSGDSVEREAHSA